MLQIRREFCFRAWQTHGEGKGIKSDSNRIDLVCDEARNFKSLKNASIWAYLEYTHTHTHAIHIKNIIGSEQHLKNVNNKFLPIWE